MKHQDQKSDFTPSKLTKWLMTIALVLGITYGGWYAGRKVTVALVNQGLVIRGTSQQIRACEADLVKRTRKAKNAKPSKKGADVIDKDKK